MGVERLKIEAEGGPVPRECGACPIRQRAICSMCDSNELSTLDQIKSYRTYAAGEEIIGAGQLWDYVGSIVSGVVKLIYTLPDGRRQMVGLLFPSDFIGRSQSRTAKCDAVAAVETTLCRFRRGPFDRLMRETPNIEQRMLEMTQDELDAAREQMLLLGRKTAKERVASFLLTLFERYRARDVEDGGFIASIPLSREDMAAYLGLTIETVSRRITELKKEGLIQLLDARTVRVSDLEALREIAADDGIGG